MSFQVVYDIETYPNVFCLVAVRFDSDERWTFEISPRRNDLADLLLWLDGLAALGGEMIGFNNLGFDYPVVHEIMTNYQCRSVAAIYLKAMSIIRSQDRFGLMIWPSDRLVPQLDLFKIHHFDNKARSTGLKALQFNMRSESVEDLPFPVGVPLADHQIDTLIRYCLHDVTETKRFALRSREAIDLRRSLTAKYGRDFMNHNDTKIGKDYLIMCLGEDVCYTRASGRREPRQTPRASIALGEIILPYVSFQAPAFRGIEAWLRRQIITETKGVFTKVDTGAEDGTAFGVKLEDHRLREHAAPATLKAGYITSLNCQVNGFTFVFGTGGIHGSLENTIVRADDTHSIWDWDVTSFYPMLGIANQLYPEHLGQAFCAKYREVFDERQHYPKGTPENAMYKLALNGTYGDSNNPYSPFYDPRYTMSITINGQLSLCMLAEQLFNVPDIQLIQVNTDGLTIRIRREHEWLMHLICEQWQATTGLSLESAQYSAIHIANVNNYIGVGTSGKTKLKGAYLIKRAWHQDQSALIVPMAAEAVMVHGANLEDFIRGHSDPFDFMCRAKVPRSSRLMVSCGGIGAYQSKIDNVVYRTIPAVKPEEWTGRVTKKERDYCNPDNWTPCGFRQTQNTSRYYVSTDGGTMWKESPPVEGAVEGQYKRKNGVDVRTYAAWDNTVWNADLHTGNKSVYATRHMAINAGWKVTECNRASEFSFGNLEYRWYIDEAMKLIIND